MSKPASFSTICTYPCVQELVGLVLSLSVHHPDSTLYIISDTKSKNYIENVMTPKARIQLNWRTTLDYASNKSRNQMEREGIWTKFQMEKATSMAWALQEKQDVMFLDSDQLVVGVIDTIDKTKDLGVSPHFMPKSITNRYGFYNGGMLWTKNKNVPKRWVETSKTSRYYDQACIEDLAREFSKFDFGQEYNIQSYRFTQGLLPMKRFMQCFGVKNGYVAFNGKRVRTFHSHFNRGDPMTHVNNFIQGMLLRAKMWREVSIVDRMLNKGWQLWIPKQPTSNLHFRHMNDSFRMYPRIWQQQNSDVLVGNHGSRNNCWLGNSVMLYDRPTLQWCNDECKVSSLILFGNGGQLEQKQMKERYNTEVRSWIFWPRDIGVYLGNRTTLSWDKRPIESIFIGNYENAVQQKHRLQGDWSSSIQEFHLTGGHQHKFSKAEYVRKLGQSRYGLCMRGFGAKCHREVELMGLGTVPIVIPGVEMDAYYERPKENVHYIRVSNPGEIRGKIDSISQSQWEQMSQACIEWFDRMRCWDTTIRAILYN